MKISKKITFKILKQTNQRYTVFDIEEKKYHSGLTEKDMINFAMNYLPFGSIDEVYKEFDRFFLYYQNNSCSELFIHQLMNTNPKASPDEISEMVASMMFSAKDENVEFFERPIIYKFPYFNGKTWSIFNELTGRDEKEDLTEQEAFECFVMLYEDVFSHQYLKNYFDIKVLKNPESNNFNVDYRKMQTKHLVYKI